MSIEDYLLRIAEGRAAQREISRVSGMPYAEFELLAAVYHNRGNSQTFYSDCLQESRHIVHQKTNKLKSKGLIETAQAYDDRREVLLDVTEKARLLIDRIYTRQEAA